MIAIIDYDAGNVGSVEKALKFLGQDVTTTRDAEKILADGQSNPSRCRGFWRCHGKAERLWPVRRDP